MGAGGLGALHLPGTGTGSLGPGWQDGNRHLAVFVDSAHGGADGSTSGVTSTGRTVYEMDLTLAAGLDLMPLLR